MDSFWTRSVSDRAAMAALLQPLVAATRPREFVGAENASAQVLAFVQGLEDCPHDIVAAAIGRLVTRGLTWMPKPGEVKAECAKVVAERRAEAWRTSLAEDCADCGGQRWRPVFVNGVERLQRCDCWTAAQKATNRIGQAITLPPSREDASEPV